MDDPNILRAKKVISNVIYATVATVSESGWPWNSPVYCAFDDKYNFYWASAAASEHSKNVRANGRLFLVIYDSTAKEMQNEFGGIYIQAKGVELATKQAIEEGAKYLYGRIGKDSKPVEEFLPPKPRRMYKATPEKFWINAYALESGKFTVDHRIEIKLL